MMFKLLLILFVFCIDICQPAKQLNELKCDRKSEHQMDVSSARLIVFGQIGVRFPETLQEFRVYCNEANRLFVQIGRYTDNCLNKFGKDSAKVLINSINTEIKSVCKSGKMSKRSLSLMEAAPCLNQGNSIFNKNCYVKFIDKYMGAMNVDIKMRIPIGCCNFFEYLRCWEIEAEKIPKCTPKVRDFFVKWFSRMLEGITQILCSVYDESNTQCDTIVKNSPLRNSTQKRFQSILLPLINIAMSLGDDDIPTE